MYESVIFDNDGVLIGMTAPQLHREGAREAFERVGVTDPDPEHVEAMSIDVTVSTLEAVCREYDLDMDTFWRERDRAMARQQQRAMRRGEKLPYDDIGVLDAVDVPMGLVSSNQQETVEFALNRFDLADYFETIYARKPVVESLHRTKPSPYYIDRALEDLNLDSGLYVGDSQTDIEAAHAAGMDAAFVRRTHREDTELTVTPEYEISGLGDVPGLLDMGGKASD